MEAVPQLARHVLSELGKVVVGQEPLKTGCLIALLCEGHALVEGVPGVAKTLTIKTLSRLLNLGYQRVQCTADLMPADITGTNVVALATGAFQFHKGPVFTDLLLVDEINRMPPRTQAALLECMEERQVTVDGVRHDLASFFSVFATQNPIEFEGTYPLPEAQLDRFLLKIRVPYPEAAEEVRILAQAQGGFDARHLEAVSLTPIDPALLQAGRGEVRGVNVEESLFAYIVQLVRKTREWPAVSLGASPRAAVNVMLVAKALAAIDGRSYIVPDDVKEAALPVLRHRLVLKPEADLEGITADQALQDVIRSVEYPAVTAQMVPATVGARARHFKRLGVAFGPRFFVLLAVGLMWLGPAFVNPRFVYAMVAWDLLVVTAWLVDVWQLPSPSDLTLQRSWTAPSALSVPSRITLTLVNQSAAAIRTTILDAVPYQLRPEPSSIRLDAGPHSEAGTGYPIVPSARGETAIGDAYIRYQSPLRIAERWARADFAQTIVTYPNLDEARRESVSLVRSQQIEMERRSRRRRGGGRSFESLREHQSGDEFRDICWTASARRGKLVTQMFEIERSQPIWIVIDAGRLMRARVSDVTKLDRAVNAALTLSQVALGSGDRVGLLAYGRRVGHYLPAARGSAHLRRIIEHLAMVQAEESEADHLLAAGRLLTDQKRRSLIVWITDVPDTAMTPEVVTAASQLMARHLVLFVVIGQPDLFRVAARKPETADQMYETAAAQEVVYRREVLLARLRSQGALALEAGAKLSPALVNAYLDVKLRNRI